jgi:chromatin assembly factor 1 subunit A
MVHPDTPLPIDPFTFVSTCIEDNQAATAAASSSDGVFAVPSLPDRFITLPANTTMNSSAPAALTPVAVSGQPKVPAPPPKTTFPDAHLPYLLEKITALQASSITFLIDSIHRDLSSQKVKKNAIEAKIREVGEKCKERRFWVIKPNVQVSYLNLRPRW